MITNSQFLQKGARFLVLLLAGAMLTGCWNHRGEHHADHKNVDYLVRHLTESMSLSEAQTGLLRASMKELPEPERYRSSIKDVVTSELKSGAFSAAHVSQALHAQSQQWLSATESSLQRLELFYATLSKTQQQALIDEIGNAGY